MPRSDDTEYPYRGDDDKPDIYSGDDEWCQHGNVVDDKPDVEFNDDGSVRINHPGVYRFDSDCHDYAEREDIEPSRFYKRPDRERGV